MRKRAPAGRVMNHGEEVCGVVPGYVRGGPVANSMRRNDHHPARELYITRAIFVLLEAAGHRYQFWPASDLAPRARFRSRKRGRTGTWGRELSPPPGPLPTQVAARARFCSYTVVGSRKAGPSWYLGSGTITTSRGNYNAFSSWNELEL